MSERTEAFRAWRCGVLTDAQLKCVVKDLQAVIDIFYAMDRAGDLSMHYLRSELDAAKRMQEGRKRP